MSKKEDVFCLMQSKKNLIDAKTIGKKYILGVYEGTLSAFDIYIKYKEKVNGKWTKQRSPKHIHWTVDMLIKQYKDPLNTEKLLKFLIKKWKKIKGLKSESKRKTILKEVFKIKIPKEFLDLNYGIYSIEFLFRLAFLLMIQEKTNNSKAFMFEDLLNALKCKKDLFSVINIATHK